MGVNSPNAVLDLSKPVLSLRKEAKDELDQSVHSSMIQYYNKLVSQKEAFDHKISKRQEDRVKPVTKNRISTAVAANKGPFPTHTRKRVMTKEGKRQKLVPDVRQMEISNSLSKSRSKDNSRSPVGIRPTSKEKSLHLSKIDEKRPSLRVKKRRMNTGIEILKKDQGGQQVISQERSKKRKKSKNKSPSKRYFA